LQTKEDRARDKEALLAKVIFDISMSLDGFMTATNVRPEAPWATAANASTSGPSMRTSATASSSPRP
jgi:hypothetical protein